MNRQSGFSLLELMVALALMAIIGAGLASALRLGTQTYSRAESLGADQDIAVARTQLRHYLARAAAPSLLTHFPNQFTGDQSQLTFVTLATPDFALDAAGTEVTIEIAQGTLTVTYRAFDDEGATVSQSSVPILENAADLRLSYFEEGEWRTTWDAQATLPRLVKIEAEPAAFATWPDFTVELLYAL